VTFQRTGWHLAGWYLFAGFLWLLTAAIAAGFVAAWFPLRSWTPGKVLFIVLAGVLGVCAVRTTLVVHSWIRHFEIYFLSVDDSGVQLRLPGVGETHIAWGEIQGIAHQKRRAEARGLSWTWLNRLDSYIILTHRGPFNFTVMEVRRPDRAARAIAERLGFEVDEPASAGGRQIS